MGADILALHVRACAEKRGDTYVASAGKIYCELVAHRPDVIETLSRPDWPIQMYVCPNPAAFVICGLAFAMADSSLPRQD
jgi:hypothetical protein